MAHFWGFTFKSRRKLLEIAGIVGTVGTCWNRVLEPVGTGGVFCRGYSTSFAPPSSLLSVCVVPSLPLSPIVCLSGVEYVLPGQSPIEFPFSRPLESVCPFHFHGSDIYCRVAI